MLSYLSELNYLSSSFLNQNLTSASSLITKGWVSLCSLESSAALNSTWYFQEKFNSYLFLFFWKEQGKSDVCGLERLNLKSLGCLCRKYWLGIRKCRYWINEEISELELHICQLSTIHRDNNWNHVRGWDHHGKEYIETRICGNKSSDQVTTLKADRTSHIIWHNFSFTWKLYWEEERN